MNHSMSGHGNPDMTRRARRAERAREQYFTSFWQEVNRLLGRTGVRIEDRDDCTSYICVWLLGREDKLVRAHTPARLAAVCTSQRAVDFIRSMVRQMPHAGYDFSKNEALLKFVSFDALVDPDKDDSFTYEEIIGDGTTIADDVVSSEIYQATLKKVLDKMTPVQQKVWTDVEINQMKVVKAAEKHGLKREYAQRRLGEARKIADEFRGDM